MHQVKVGEAVVVAIRPRVTPLDRRDPGDVFAFMGSEVSTERPKELVVAAIVQAMQEARATGTENPVCRRPCHSAHGAGRNLEAIIPPADRHLFAGNALATHDIERALYGTSLGVELATGAAMAHGHEHHLRAINTVRACGGIRQAVEKGVLTSGVMHACVTTGIDFVLAGSIRDDGPLLDVITTPSARKTPCAPAFPAWAWP